MTETAVISETMRLWLEALVEGDYVQGMGGLHYKDDHDGHDHFCCIGVLADVMGTTWHPVSNPLDENKHFFCTDTGESGILDPSDVKHLGLHNFINAQEAYYLGELGYTRPGYFEEGMLTRMDVLAKLNDSGAPFSVIVQTIKDLRWDIEL